MLKLIGLGTVVYFGWVYGVIQTGMILVASVLTSIAGIA